MYRRILFTTIVLTLVFCICTPTAAQAPTPESAPVRVMFVGDCHSWFLNTYLPKLAASGDPPVVVEAGACAGGGYPLDLLWKLGGVIRPVLKALQAGEGKWDVGVIGAGYWYEGRDEKLFTDSVPKFDEAFKKAGARTIITASWADRADAGTDAVPKMTALANSLAAQLGARVAPVGLAVERVRHERAGLVEYVDDGHVNAPGWYLQMCVLYATLFERSPQGLKYRLDDVRVHSEEGVLWNLPAGWALPDADAAYLQKIAWDTVTEQQTQK